ncbi:hypothetical protein SERLADRAFT_432499 [Serpula lacrymans var. lacrymans S7.9]|uniref:Uncharacterized protein n=1 Tax=Serpula lacrymans var. lacrymans (strain S7.9) TaxID=578457 RepID=F8NFH7_SERL9|nr:uncharacterized protein SERLADRAFT_432499 [Serpula lacrymans var. lacrymans S7.9]EGO30856.1 hypothetical protein SERLADRAFT_432499 [Serpula lacrymans var. lacrymans S7.9]
MASKTLGPGITLRRQKSNHMVIPDSKEKRVSVGGNEQYKEDSDLSPPPPSRFRHRRNLSPPPPSQVQCRSSRAIDIPASEEDIAETHWGDFDNGTQLDMANPGDCSINESGGLGVATRERVSKHTEVDERAREDIEESDEEERPKKKKKMNMREAGALARCGAAVEHIFTKQSQVPILCAEDKEEDDVSLEGRNSMSTGKSFLKPIPQLNVLSGKETTVHDNFSSANWGAATRG